MSKIITLFIIFVVNFNCFAKQIFVIGCGGSGTHFTSALLQASNLDVGMEKMGKDGSVSWYLTPNVDVNQDNYILHQVRHPLKVIRFYTTAADSSWRYIEKHIPQINTDDTLIQKAAKFWYYWNLIAEKKAHFTYKIEELPFLVNKIEKYLEVSLNRNFINTHCKEGFGTRTHLYKANIINFNWQDLQKEIDNDLYEKIVKLAYKYGYQ